MDKSYKRDLTPASFIHTKLSEVNKTLGKIARSIENMAKQLKIKVLALALTNEIFRITNIRTFKQVCNEELDSTLILLYQPPKSMENLPDIQNVIAVHHETPIGGHIGANRLYKKLRCLYKWKNMKKSIFDFVRKCLNCRQNKHTIKTNENFTLTPTPHKPFDSIAMDAIRPFAKSDAGNRYALTIQCDLSKYIITKAIPNKQADTLAKAFVESFVLIYGTPSIIRTDQGTEYKNEIFNKIAELLQMKHSLSTPYHPQTIGSLERNHRCLNEYIRQFINEFQSDWDNWLPYYSFCYNTTPRPDFHYTPYELIFGHPVTLPQNLKNPKALEPNYNLDQYHLELKQKLQAARLRTGELLDKQKIDRNNKHETQARPIEIKLNDKVMITNENRNKLNPVYKGPYTVVAINHPNVTISNENAEPYTVHKNRLIKMS